MTMFIRKMIVLFIWVVVVLLVAYPVQGQESKQDKVKLTGGEIKELLLKPGTISFGITHKPNVVWILEALENRKYRIYWRSLVDPIVWGTDIGTRKIVGDQICAKGSFGAERCNDMYGVGEDKYETWRDGALAATWFKGQIEYETNKDKVKLTGAELKESRESLTQHTISAGINVRNKFVNIVIDYGDGKRELYWRSTKNPGLSMSVTGTTRIVGDQICVKMIFGPERCLDLYRTGEDRMEVWRDGSILVNSYRLK